MTNGTPGSRCTGPLLSCDQENLGSRTPSAHRSASAFPPWRSARIETILQGKSCTYTKCVLNVFNKVWLVSTVKSRFTVDKFCSVLCRLQLARLSAQNVVLIRKIYAELSLQPWWDFAHKNKANVLYIRICLRFQQRNYELLD